jgi:hypothetical protein
LLWDGFSVQRIEQAIVMKLCAILTFVRLPQLRIWSKEGNLRIVCSAIRWWTATILSIFHVDFAPSLEIVA